MVLKPDNFVAAAPDGRPVLFHLLPLKGSYFLYVSDVRNQSFEDLHVCSAVRPSADGVAVRAGSADVT